MKCKWDNEAGEYLIDGEPCKTDDCGEPDNAPCRCYAAVADLTLADLKGLFAMSDMTVDPTDACCGPGEGCSSPDCTGTPAAGVGTPEPVDDIATESPRFSGRRDGHPLTKDMGGIPVPPGSAGRTIEAMAGIRPACPTCEGLNRQTVDMVCPTCGFDYACTCGRVWEGHPNPHAITCPRHVEQGGGDLG